MKKLTYVLPVTDELLADWRPSPNVCVPWIGHGCFTHTVPSWLCGDLVTANSSSLGRTNARYEVAKVLRALADRINNCRDCHSRTFLDSRDSGGAKGEKSNAER